MRAYIFYWQMYPSEDGVGWIVNIAPEDALDVSPVTAGSVSLPRRQTGSWEDKEHKCQYPGCSKAFYHKQHLRRHETVAHGRMQRRNARQLQTVKNSYSYSYE